MKMKVAAVQLLANEDVERNLNAADALIDEAAAKGTRGRALRD